MRTELVESKAKREVLERELHNLLLQLHSQQLSYLPDSKSSGKKQDTHIIPDINNIKKKLEAEIKQSPVHLNSGKKITNSFYVTLPILSCYRRTET